MGSRSSLRRGGAAAAALVAVLGVTGLLTVPTALAAPSSAGPAGFSAAQLDRAQRLLDQRLGGVSTGVTSWGLDPATGRIAVSVVAGDRTALRLARSATADVPEAVIITTTEKIHRTSNLVSGQAITGPTSRCSIAFSALNAARTQAVVLTAGHCTKTGETWSGANGVPIGPVLDSDFPGNDFSEIRVESTSTWTPTAQVQGDGTTLTVVGSVESGIGARVCRSGSTTGYHCGTVLAKNQSVNYTTGGYARGLTKTDACAQPGDSGGPFFSFPYSPKTVQAQGLTSGGSGTCSSGGAVTYFQPIAEVLTVYGLSLYTSSTTPLPAKPNVVLCSDANYRGTCVVSNTDQPLMITSAVGQDMLSSVKVAAGTWLSLYADDNYAGACQSFTADRAFLGGTRIGNDQVSSYKITTTAPANCPTT